MLAFLLLAAVGSTVAAKKAYRIAGAVGDESGKWKPAEVLEQVRRDIRFQISYLQPRARPQVIESAIGRPIDLLPGRIDENRPGFHVFVLQIENGSGMDLNFNPTQARMATDSGDVEFAMDYTAFYEASRALGDSGPSFDEVARIAFDRAVTVRPGGSVRKLLVFAAPGEDKYKTVEVRLHELAVGTEAENVVFPFRKFQVEEP